jgi:3-oxoacyl-[acyl-carrier-protein] synthase-3
MNSVQIIGTGAHLPGEPLTNEVIESLAGPLPDDVLEGIQVRSRHWLADPQTGEHRDSNSGMACGAARAALADAGVEPEEVELLVVSTSSPDYVLPPMATFVQERLGLERCAAVEIRSGCAGAIEALDLARLYLQSGQFRTALVIGSEAISPLLIPIFQGREPSSVRMRDRIGVYSFGDAAGAIVLRATETAGSGILGSAIASVGGTRKPGMQIVGGGTHAPIHRQLQARRLVDLKVDVVASARHTPYVLTEALTEVLRRSEVKADDVDLCIVPEGNAGYLTDELREAGLLTPEWLALQPKMFENLATVGATGSAAVPVALDEARRGGRLAAGDLVMLLAIETSKWKYAGTVASWTKAGG